MPFAALEGYPMNRHGLSFACIALLGVATGCGDEASFASPSATDSSKGQEVSASSEVSSAEALTTAAQVDPTIISSIRGMVYFSDGKYAVRALKGTTGCPAFTSAPTCSFDKLDFQLAPPSFRAQSVDIENRLRASASDLGHATLVLYGRWKWVFYRVGRKSFREDTFQVEGGYAADVPRAHSTTFYYASGNTEQFLAEEGIDFGARTIVTWKTPVPLNSAGVLSSGLITGTLTSGNTVPLRVTEDQYFRKL
jgi:hypothetical protein